MKNLTLEVSLRPFYGLDESGIQDVCVRALEQWRTLVDRADQVSVMFFAADGSEILEYAGDLDAEMEWGRYIGIANAHTPIENDPERRSIYASPRLYRPDAKPIPYRRLAAIAGAWRKALAAEGKPARIGLVFDPGGEFALSDFKYKRHPEVCLSDTLGKSTFVCCYGVLNADTHPYAGFPQGIPQGTSMGTFLGRQFQRLAADISLDFIWFSNGFGFGMETWFAVGPLFDGKAFYPGKARETRDRILAFWKDFRRECPHLGIETRGTNLGTGTDLASDATPLRELYEGGFDFAPPPNSPWASINGDFGIEIAGYLSRIAELPPGRGIPFRFYIHDPWFLTSTWLDRYEGQPHDIYLPLAVGRVDASGRIEAAQTLSLLTIDNSQGQMPEVVPVQVTPHLLRAWEELPDAAGPLVWLYPFDQLHDAMFAEIPTPERLFHTDWFAREAINDGLPLNTVVSTRAFALLGDRAREVLGGRILLTPAPFDAETERRLLAWVDAGEKLIAYGPLDSAPILRERLGLAAAPSLSGPLDVFSKLSPFDRSETGEPTVSFVHNPIMSGGALQETSPGGSPLLSAVSRETGETRTLGARFDTPAGGRLWWLRAPLPLHFENVRLPEPFDKRSTFPFSETVRQALADLGWRVAFRSLAREQRHPVLAIHRHDNGWFFSGCVPDTTVEISLHTPFGAPLLLGAETVLRAGAADYRLPRGWRHECRVFLEQEFQGRVSCVEAPSHEIGITRRLSIQGLQNGLIRFFPPAGAKPVVLVNAQWPFITGEILPLREIPTPQGPMLEAERPISGNALLSW